MSVVPAFIRVIPAEVARYGPAAAIVLAHIRYRCVSSGPGRIKRGDVYWWRVSHSDMAREVGMSVDKIKRALRRLREAVSANHFPPLDDQTRAYRVTVNSNASDLPVGESAHPSDVRVGDPAHRPYANTPTPLCESAQDPHADPPSVLPIETLEKRREADAGAPGAPNDAEAPGGANNGELTDAKIEARKQIHAILAATKAKRAHTHPKPLAAALPAPLTPSDTPICPLCGHELLHSQEIEDGVCDKCRPHRRTSPHPDTVRTEPSSRAKGNP
jgi:hypothetical protein